MTKSRGSWYSRYGTYMVSIQRCCGFPGAVSLRKSHDIVILSFCNIVKGQARYDPKLYIDWIFLLKESFQTILTHSMNLILYITSAEIDWISFTTKRYCSSIFSIAQPHNIIDIEKWYTFQAPKSISRAIFPDFEERAREKGVPKCGLKRLSF